MIWKIRRQSVCVCPCVLALIKEYQKKLNVITNEKCFRELNGLSKCSCVFFSFIKIHSIWWNDNHNYILILGNTSWNCTTETYSSQQPDNSVSVSLSSNRKLAASCALCLKIVLIRPSKRINYIHIHKLFQMVFECT